MELTPDQQAQIRQARANGDQRATLDFTAEQKQSWQEAVDQELAGKDANIAWLRKIKAAAEQPGLFGDVRRAILTSRRPVTEIAAAIGTDAEVLSAFRAGESDLPAALLDRLVGTLGLRLMQEIRR
jgi:hypothetical protein